MSNFVAISDHFWTTFFFGPQYQRGAMVSKKWFDQFEFELFDHHQDFRNIVDDGPGVLCDGLMDRIDATYIWLQYHLWSNLNYNGYCRCFKELELLIPIWSQTLCKQKQHFSSSLSLSPSHFLSPSLTLPFPPWVSISSYPGYRDTAINGTLLREGEGKMLLLFIRDI